VDDYAEFAGDVRAKFAGGPGAPPAFAAGQSMGGLLATHLVLRDQAAWAGLILCSAAIDLEWNLVTRRAPRPSRPACPLHAWMGTCRSRRAAGRPGPGSCMNMRGMTNVVQSLAMQLSLLHTLPSWRPGQPRSRAAKQVVHAAAASPAVLCAAATRSGLLGGSQSPRPAPRACKTVLEPTAPGSLGAAGYRRPSGTCWRSWCRAGASCRPCRSSTSATTRPWCAPRAPRTRFAA